MLTRRAATERGHTQIGWLDSHHSFSFGGYMAPRHMGHGPLRVINDDLIEGKQGFGTHPHDNMEIISYMATGTLSHQDSMGTERDITPGEVQVMSAGTGLTHSEYNRTPEQVRLLQIWILPDRRGHAPRYDQKRFPIDEQRDRLHLLVSPDGADGSLPIHQDARIWAARLSAGTELPLPLATGRKGWVQIVTGDGSVNGITLRHGDGLAVEDEAELSYTATTEAELLVFDLPA